MGNKNWKNAKCFAKQCNEVWHHHSGLLHDSVTENITCRIYFITLFNFIIAFGGDLLHFSKLFIAKSCPGGHIATTLSSNARFYPILVKRRYSFYRLRIKRLHQFSREQIMTPIPAKLPNTFPQKHRLHFISVRLSKSPFIYKFLADQALSSRWSLDVRHTFPRPPPCRFVPNLMHRRFALRRYTLVAPLFSFQIYFFKINQTCKSLNIIFALIYSQSQRLNKLVISF